MSLHLLYTRYLLPLLLNTQYIVIMKKSIFLILMFFPLMNWAQNTWELPNNNNNQEESTKKEAIIKKNKTNPDAKYLEGAVPEVDGKVVFTLDKKIPEMSAEEIYRKVYNVIEELTKEENQFPISRIAVVNKAEYTIAARMKEWLVFQNSFLSLDRTIFNYTLIAKADDGHIHMTLERINYQYELDRGENQGLEVKAEDWIVDKEGLNKKRTKLAKYSGKFRKKTIDRKDNIFSRVCNALQIPYEY